MSSLDLVYVTADSAPALIADVRRLMEEYAALPHITGRWHDPQADIDALPHPFVPPAGALALIRADGQPAACGALLHFAPGIVEMKRVYVNPHFRQRGLAQQLCVQLIARATAHGYRRMVLDTAPELLAARALYEHLGFTPIAPYREGLREDTLFYARELSH